MTTLQPGKLEVTFEAILTGMAVVLAGTIPRNLLFMANFRYGVSLPWAVPLTALYIWFFWRYLRGAGPPESTSEYRRDRLRANRLSARVWAWALLAGGAGIVALVLALRLANRFVALPPQQIPDLDKVPAFTMVALLLLSAPVAGIIEEAAFRGYMQGPLERRFGLPIAILITGSMFGFSHLDFTPVLWLYYVAVAAIYGTVSYLTNSTLPAIVLHTAGNLYSNFDLWLHGQAEWQAPASQSASIWTTGPDSSFWMAAGSLILTTAAMIWTYSKLAQAAKATRSA
jgi:membrane protease YdiL (CAAX protease family)